MKIAKLTVKFNNDRYFYKIPYNTHTYISDIVLRIKYFIEELGKVKPELNLDTVTFIEVTDEEDKSIFLCENKVQCEMFLETGTSVYKMEVVIQDTDNLGLKHIKWLLTDYPKLALNLSILDIKQLR